MYSESVLNSSYLHNEIETRKVLACLKMMLTFLSQATRPPVSLFMIEVKQQYSSYF